jgi:hypothetical protein
MLNINEIVTRIQTLGYSVELLNGTDINNFNPENSPTIYIGYKGILSQYENNNITLNALTVHGGSLNVTYEVQIFCEIKDFPTIWKQIYNKLVGWNPTLEERLHTSFTYNSGGVMPIASSLYMRWLDIWTIGFNSVNPI